MDEPKETGLDNTPPQMNIVGSGKLGRTLARLFSDAGLVNIRGIYNRNIESSQSAQAFIGAGHALADSKQLATPAVTLWMLACPDDAISSCATQLAELSGINWKDGIIFHCSGLKTATDLAPLKNLGAGVASVHPAHSFASPEHSLTSFPSTVCTFEGDARATNILKPLFSAIGGQIATIQPAAKPLYHAATVVASNYLIALISASEALLENAGIEAPMAGAILTPLMQQSLQNGLKVGPVKALTGPIARGDINTIRAHIKAIEQRTPEILSVYSSMGTQALKLAKKQDRLGGKELAAIEQLLYE